MEKLRNTILIASLVFAGLTIPVRAEMATIDEALTVAKNWITTIIHHEGDWGGHESAYVEEIQEFTRDGRLLGYFCRVKPSGYLVISLHKELSPVKAFSESGSLSAESDGGLSGLLKSDLECTLDTLAKQLAPAKTEQMESVQSLLDARNQSSWEKLEPDAQSFKAGLESGTIVMAYNPGTWLLSSNWHQGWPYNKECPNKGCTEPGLNGHAWVGCTATAASQIMRYWSWPPRYNWLNMPNSVTGDSPEEIDAVATLCNDAGNRAGMIYTCDFSFLFPAMMAASMENSFHYNARSKVWDPTISVSGWHKMLKEDLDKNRPVLYGYLASDIVSSHSVVVDGWRQVGENMHWHMNYGWGKGDYCNEYGCNAWYSIDSWPISAEIVQNITPARSLGSQIGGEYPCPSYPYRYFDQDCTNSIFNPIVAFAAGHNLQFLPGVRVSCLNLQGFEIRFESTSSENTRLFSIKGTRSARIKINDAAIVLHPGGGIRFH